MTEYDIWLNSTRRLHEWILQQPNLVLVKQPMDDRIYCQFNHTPQEEITFKRNILKRLFQIDIGNNTFTDLLKQLEEIQTDQLFFTTETQTVKNNIGTTYTNVFTTHSGRPFFIDTTGFTRMAVQILWTKSGTGTQTLRIVDDTSGTQIVESPSLVTGSNDFADVNIPQGALNFKGRWRIQCKSTVANDGPTFVGMRLYLRR